jgi:ferredoxin hydrogenase
MCEQDIAVGSMYKLADTGDVPICIHCGQCANVCPVNSITEQYEYHAVRAAIADPGKVVIFSTSPSVRVGIGEEFGFAPGTFMQGKMVAALRALGADYVLDTNFSADLTIMEEAAEMVERITQKNGPLPQFTSCCPAWIKFVETFYPELLTHISSAKSPIGMQGPSIKTWFARQMNIDPRSIVNVALTPCTAKKFEIRREEMCDAGKELNIDGLRDMDQVITTRELAKWLREEGIDFKDLPSDNYDSLMGEASGAGVIFGNSGGVMEAAARTAWFMVTGENPPADFYRLEPVRGMEGIKSASLNIAGTPLRLVVVHGIGNARTLIEHVKHNTEHYDFIEVMACPGGCIGGGGQPKTAIPMTDEIRSARIAALYSKDGSMTLRCSYDNPEIREIYDSFYGKPLSPLAERLLHTYYYSRLQPRVVE